MINDDLKDEDISIRELIEKLELFCPLPYRLLTYKVSSDFLNAKLYKNGSRYTLTLDNLKLIINYTDRKHTIQKFVYDDKKIIGKVILGFNSFQIIN